MSLRFGKIAALIVACVLGLPSVGHAATMSAVVVSACGTPPATYTPGQSFPVTQDTSGKLCTAGGGGTGGITIGQPVTGGTPSTDLYVDASGNIANSTTLPFGMTYNPVVNTSGLTISGFSLTGTDTHSLLDLSGTWNVGTTVETAIKLNMTDTASGVASRLFDVQVGGVSKFNIQKDGSLFLTTNGLSIATAGTAGVGSLQKTVVSDQLYQSVNGALNWSSSATAVTPIDLTLLRDAANTLAQRNGVNAQTSRIYNTFTDASNYERANIGWNANVFSITTGAAGTGTSRNISITNAVGFGVNIGGANQFIGSITFASDNTYDIGASGATRPRTGYFGTSVVTPTVSNPSGAIAFVVTGTAGFTVNAASIAARLQVDITDGSGSNIATLKNTGIANMFGVGGSTSSFPAFKRSSATLQVRLADDSDDADLTTRTVKGKGFTVSTLPTPQVAGRFTYITDQLTTCAVAGASLTGGGSAVCPVFDNGTAWVGG